jgi:hypothetical protein
VESCLPLMGGEGRENQEIHASFWRGNLLGGGKGDIYKTLNYIIRKLCFISKFSYVACVFVVSHLTTV